MALQFEQVQTKWIEKGEDKLGLCVCIYRNWMAIDYLQDGDHGMGQVLVDAMVGLSLLGNAGSCFLAVVFGPSVNHVKLITSFHILYLSIYEYMYVSIQKIHYTGRWSIDFGAWMFSGWWYTLQNGGSLSYCSAHYDRFESTKLCE